MIDDPRKRPERGVLNDLRREPEADEPPSTATPSRPRRPDPRVESEEGALADEPVAPVAVPVVMAKEAEDRARAAESKAATLAAALDAAQKVRDQLEATLASERQEHERAIARLEERVAALQKLADDRERALEDVNRAKDAEPPTPREAQSQAAEASSQRSPKYYGAKTVTVVQVPENSGGPNKRVLGLAAKVVIFLLVAGIAYQNRDVLRHAVAPISDIPKSTGAQEAIVRIVGTLKAEESARGVPEPAEFSDYLRKGADSTQADPSKDPWGTPYRLEVDTKNYAVRSAGSDSEYGTDDDIVVRQARSLEH
jgi:hypothetical protein